MAYKTSFSKSVGAKPFKYGPSTSLRKREEKKPNLDIPELATQVGVKPKPKKPGVLSRIGGFLSAGETGDLAYRIITGDDPRKSFKLAAKGVAFGGMEGKKTYSDVLRELGVSGEDIGSKLVRGIGGTALDIALDPTTYVSLGGSAAAKLAGKEVVEEGTEQLMKLGSRLGGEALEQGGKRALKIGGREVAQIGGAARAAAEAYFEPLTLGKRAINELSSKSSAFKKIASGVQEGLVEAFGGKYGKLKLFLQKEGSEELLDNIKNFSVRKQEAVVESIQNNFKRWERVIGEEPTVEQLQTFMRATVLGLGEDLDKHVSKAVTDGVITQKLDKKVAEFFDNNEAFSKLYKDYLVGFRKNTLEPLLDELGYEGDRMINYMTTTKLPSDVIELFKSNLGLDVLKGREGKLIQQSIKEARPFERMVLMESQLRLAKAKKDNVVSLIDNMGDMAKKIEEITSSGRIKKGFEIDADNNVVRVWRDGATEAYEVPKEVAEAINGVYNPSKTPEMLKWFDKAQSIWKSSVTTWFPSFHVRNGLSNNVNLFLAGVRDPQVISDGVKILKASDDVVEFAGNRLSYGDISRVMSDRGLFDIGRLGIDLSEESLGKIGFSTDEIKKLKTSAITPNDTLWKKVRNKLNPREIGNAVENHAKAALFIDRLKKGDSFDKAAEWVRTYLFDYGDLSGFEAGTMKRVMPFYTFFRKNLELQTKILFGGLPGRKVYKGLFKAMNNTPEIFGEPLSEEEQKYVPEWVRDTMNVPLGKDENGNPVFIYSLGLGIEELANLTPRDLMTRVSPFIKTPIELITGETFFTGKDIKEDRYYKRGYPIPSNLPGFKQFLKSRPKEVPTYGPGGERVGTKTVTEVDPTRQYLLSSLAGRGISTIGKVTDVRKTPWQRAMNTLTGFKVASVDTDWEKTKQEREMERQLAELMIDLGYLKEFKTYYRPKD